MSQNHPTAYLEHIEPLPQSFDFLGLDIAPGQLAEVVAALETALADPENWPVWNKACDLVRAEEAQFPKHGPDLGMVQVAHSTLEPLSDYLGRMRPDGIYPGDIGPSFSLARNPENPKILASLARLAYKLSRFKEARDAAEVESSRQDVAARVNETIH